MSNVNNPSKANNGIPALSPKIEGAVHGVPHMKDGFTKKTTIANQVAAHETAKGYLKEWLPKIGAEVDFISHTQPNTPYLTDITINQNELDPAVFSCQETRGVREDIQADGRGSGEIVFVYGVASQFNGSEATNRWIAPPGTAFEAYKSDRTQGPQAQLAFSRDQVELINCGGNLGFNALCKAFTDETRAEVVHGYLSPVKDKAKKVIEQLRKNGKHIEYPCIGNRPSEGVCVVYEALVAAPAFGGYISKPQLRVRDQDEIEFLCALHAFRAQFEHCIKLAEKTKKPVHLKAVGVGLGVFSNDAICVAKGFYQAGLEYQEQMKDHNVKVIFQLFRGGPVSELPAADQMAQALGLTGYKPPLFKNDPNKKANTSNGTK